MSPLNDSQQRHLAVGFAHVDRLLQQVERLAEGKLSPFAQERPDIQEDEARLLQAFASQARARMLAALDRLGIPRPRPSVSARWSIETSLRFAEIALSEIDAKGLAAYGPIDPGIAAEASALAADLRALLARGTALLHESDAGQLRQCLEALTSPVGEVLRALERLSTTHGLVEIRPLLQAAGDRAADHSFVIGVFGRVGVGKSSLINALAGGPVLPVGTTPVTAVLMRLSRGPAGATVRLLERGARTIPLEQIAEYATEEQNPDNRRGVRAIDVTVPELPDGLRLVDTPGLGSLARSGPAAAMAALPRCDLGIVLVQAGAPLGRDELTLIAGLAHAGVASRVLISKGDLLPAEDREKALDYVATELAAALGPNGPVEVGLVSIRPEGAAYLDSFRREVIEPLVRDHARASVAALRSRLHRLVAVTAAALAGRRGGAGDRSLTLQRDQLAAAERIRQVTDRLALAGSEALETAAAAVAGAWAEDGDGTAAARRAVQSPPNAALAAVREAVEHVRGSIPSAADAVTPGLPPLFDAALLESLPIGQPPRLARRLLGIGAARRALRPWRAPVGRAFADYAQQVRSWGVRAVDELALLGNDLVPVAQAPLEGELGRLDGIIDAALSGSRAHDLAGGTAQS